MFNFFPSRRIAVLARLLALSFTTTLLATSAWSAEKAPGVKNIVLVHGAFADGGIWSDVIRLLQARGYHVTAVQNPLTSLADDVEATRRVLARQKGDVLLVGHSWAGAVVTEAGNAANVKGIVYLSALAPDSNESVAELLKKRDAPMEGLQPDANGLIWLDDPTVFAHVMAGDVSSKRAAVLAATQQPMAAKAFGESITHAAWLDKPTWYLVTQGDNALPTPVQEWIAKHIGAKTATIKSSHMSMISHPYFVADLIAKAAREAR